MDNHLSNKIYSFLERVKSTNEGRIMGFNVQDHLKKFKEQNKRSHYLYKLTRE